MVEIGPTYIFSDLIQYAVIREVLFVESKLRKVTWCIHADHDDAVQLVIAEVYELLICQSQHVIDDWLCEFVSFHELVALVDQQALKPLEVLLLDPDLVELTLLYDPESIVVGLALEREVLILHHVLNYVPERVLDLEIFRIDLDLHIWWKIDVRIA